MATLKATAAGQTLVGPAGQYDYFTDFSGGDIFIGGGFNDTFYVTDAATTIQEQAGASASVYAYVSYSTPDNVSNMFVGTPWITGVANPAGTAMTALSKGDTLVAGSGSDVMTDNGVGFTNFEFKQGTGHDVVNGFIAGSGAGHDYIRLDNYGFTNFAQVQPLLSQAGSDVLLTLSSTDSVLIKNVSLTNLTASDFLLQLDRSTLGAPTFDEEFNSLSLQMKSTETGTWRTYYGQGNPLDYTSRTFTANNEQEIYVDPEFAGSSTAPLGLNPFSINNGVLTITASKTPTNDLSSLWNYPYISGQLDTEASFTQEYGYFEMRAELPQTQGAWPAFWLLPIGHTGELDIMEQFGQPDVFGTAISSTYTITDPTYRHSDYVPTSLSGFHTYGLMWTPTTLTWYVDGVATGTSAAASDMNEPMYIILNLAAGGAAGTANFTSANMQVDYVRAYALPSTQAPSPLVVGFGTVSFTDTGVQGDHITDNGAVKFAGTMSDGVAVSGVDVFNGTTLLGHATLNTTAGTWSMATTLANGTYSQLTAVATDIAGNTASAAAGQSLQVDTVPPAATFNTVSFTDTGVQGDHITDNGGVTFAGTVSDGVGMSGVNVFNGTTLLGHATLNTTAGTWSLATTLANGTYSQLTAVAADVAGNTASAAASKSLQVDTVPPTVAFNTVSSLTPGGSAVTFAGTVSDSVGVTGVDVFNGTTLLGHASLDTIAGTWSLATTLANGTYSQLTAVATDAAGNTASGAAAQTVQVGTAPPAISFNTLSFVDTGVQGDQITDNGAVTFAGMVSDSVGVSGVDVFNGTTLLGHAGVDATAGTWSLSTILADGLYNQLLAVASDQAGNTAYANMSQLLQVDTTPPVPTIKTEVKNGSTFTLTGTATEASAITVQEGTKVLGTVNTSGNGSWQLTTPALSSSVHTFSVTAQDPAGNVGAGTGLAVYGTTGNDALTGGPGNDLLTGGGGTDIFSFAGTLFGQDVVTDFAATRKWHDIIQFSQTAFTNYSDMMSHTSQVGANVVIQRDASDSVTLAGVQLNQLSSSDFRYS